MTGAPLSPRPPHASPIGLVCLVDDDASIRRSLERLLRSANFRVQTYDSAIAFLQRLPTEEGPRCVLMDVQMPGMDGLEAQKHLCATRWPIVFLTAVATEEMRRRALEAGAICFLIKPVEEKALFAAVTCALAKSAETVDATGQKPR